MLSNILTRLNWVDILAIFLLLRILYISSKTGFVVELFKLIGTISTIYISLHYYSGLSDFILKRVSKQQFAPGLIVFIIFIFLVTITYLFFVLLRQVFCHLVKMQAVPLLSKWGGIILGSLRALLTAGLIIFILSISTAPYLRASVKKSYSASRLFALTVSTYAGLWDGFMSKFMANEKFNYSILKSQKDSNK